MTRFLAIPAAVALLAAADPKWTFLSSSKGDLPDPGGSDQQTGLLVAQLSRQRASDFVISYRVKGPALVWFRRDGAAWKRSVIEPEFLTVEAGGAAFDMDNDGDLDVVFGADSQGSQLWWWENPFPHFRDGVPWKRRLIKDGGARQHHDRIFADIEGTGRPQLIFWNQKAKTLFLARIPEKPRESGLWKLETIFQGQAGEDVDSAAKYAEGLDAFDVNGDGRLDLLAGNSWFQRTDNGYRATRVGSIGGRIRAGRFAPGRNAQVVIAPGDGSGPLRYYENSGDAADPAAWKGRDLLPRDMVHGHTLDIGDIDGDGRLDVLAAEMAKWSRKPEPDHPEAAAWVLYGDGRGGFRVTEVAKGRGWHEGRIADFDGDGDLDIVDKPYTWNAPRVDLLLNNGTAKPKSPGKTKFQQRVSMELWTYREELKKDLAGTLEKIRNMGFTDVETSAFYGLDAAGFRKALNEAGLGCSSLIVPYARLGKDLDGVIADAKALGAKYVLTAGIPRKGPFTAEIARKAAGDFTDWGKRLQAEELRFGYHPHGFEFVPYEGGNLFDLLLEETSPEYVTYEMDVFWFAQGGADPLRYLTKYPRRFELLHLKDLAYGTAVNLTGRAPDETSVPLGQGSLDIPAILRAAVKAGIRWYYIEDEHPDAAAQVPRSMRYLEQLRY